MIDDECDVGGISEIQTKWLDVYERPFCRWKYFRCDACAVQLSAYEEHKIQKPRKYI